ncbi:farnesol dehydrogenase-like isoform X2 [Augochlora pura]
MERWAGKVALVTGASDGIGLAIAKSLVEHNVQVVGLARRFDKLQEVARQLGKNKFYPVQCDVTKESDILRSFKWAEEKLGGVDILVNNAAVIMTKMIMDSTTEECRKVLDTNLMAPMIFAREFINAIRKRNTPGHIINMSSIVGRYPETFRTPLGIHGVSKSGLYTLGVELRHEILLSNLDIKITTINPGGVFTDMIKVAFNRGDDIAEVLPLLSGKDIADTVISAISASPVSEIFELTVLPQHVFIGSPVPQVP